VQEKSQKWVKEVLLKEYDSFEFYTGPSFNTEGALAMMIYEGVPHELVRCEYYKYPARRRRRRSDSRSLVISVTVSQVSGEEEEEEERFEESCYICNSIASIRRGGGGGGAIRGVLLYL